MLEGAYARCGSFYGYVAVPAGALLGGAAGTALFLWGLWPIKGFIVINVTVAPLAPIILAGKGAYEGGKLCWK